MEPRSTERWSGLFARLRDEQRAREALLARRREQARALARTLVDGFGVRKVILFGSVARGESPGRLDIDLAVLGLDEADELRALSALSEEAGCPVDLVRLETASPRLISAVERDGQVLDERR